MYTFQALQVLIFLIPGFIAAKILGVFIVTDEKKEFEKIIEAIVFSLIIYTIYSIIPGKSPIALNQDKETITYLYNGISFLKLLLLSLFIPILMGWCVTNDCHMKFARFLRISRKTSRNSVWFDVFCDKKAHIIINFEDGRRIYGWPQYYSNTPKEPYIFLYNPAWILTDKNEQSVFEDINIDGILISPNQKIESIEFLKE